MAGLEDTLGLLEDAGESGPSLILTFEKMPVVRADRFCARIAGLEPLREPPRITVEPAPPPGALFLAHVLFGGHTVDLTGFGGPVSKEVLDRTVGWSPCSPEQKQAVQRHATHVVCAYAAGSDRPAEQYIALYKIAWGFVEAGLTGILNEEAWTCQPVKGLEKLVAPEALARYRQAIPLLFWTGMIRLPTATGVWFVTRGQNRFGVPDLAYLARDQSEAETVTALFANVFQKVWEAHAYVEEGQTLQVGNEFFRFEEVPSQLGLPRGSRTLEITRRLRPDDDALAALP